MDFPGQTKSVNSWTEFIRNHKYYDRRTNQIIRPAFKSMRPNPLSPTTLYQSFKDNEQDNNNNNSKTSTSKKHTDYFKSSSYSKHYNKNVDYYVHPRVLLNSAIDGMSLGSYTIPSAYKARVVEAYRDRRIFTIYGNFLPLREALQDRGWLEKLAPGHFTTMQHLPEYVLLQYAKKGNTYEAVILSKISKNFPAFFIWQPKEYHDVNAEVVPHRNRVRQARVLDFSTKVGLIGCAEHEEWYKIEGIAGMNHPRFYRVSINSDDREAFIEDFRQTQCRSLVRFLIENMDQLDAFVSLSEGTVDLCTLEMAVMVLKRELNEANNDSLDSDAPVAIEYGEWRDLLKNSSLIFNRRSKFKARLNDVVDCLRSSQIYLAKLDKLHADYKWDGVRNLWILKPGSQSCGIGILIKSSLEDILKFTANNACLQYIVQKYIGE